MPAGKMVVRGHPQPGHVMVVRKGVLKESLYDNLPDDEGR